MPGTTPTVRIYTRAGCGYCDAALDLLQSKGIAYRQIDVGGDHETRRWLHEVTGRRTVPQIFLGDRPIGGYTALRRLDDRGELDAMLEGARPAMPG
jgi:glutaredoxin 3